MAGFPHSEIFGSKVVCYLPEAYRKLQRPSSPLAAKASTVYAYSLDYITQNSLFTRTLQTCALQLQTPIPSRSFIVITIHHKDTSVRDTS